MWVYHLLVESEKMKKLCLLITSILLFMCGCDNVDAFDVEEHRWVVTSVQSKEDGGQEIAYGASWGDTSDTSDHVELICTAKNGVLTLVDNTNEKVYRGTYKIVDADIRSTVYEVALGDKDGVAVSAMTTFNDGSQKPTFIIDICGYVINFFSE